MKYTTMNLEKAQKDVLTICNKLLEYRLAVRSWGNVSMRFGGEHMLITPSGRLYTDLQPNEMVLVSLTDLGWEGDLTPSSEYRLHAYIYKERKQIGAVIHTHQPLASILAAAHRELPAVLDDMAQILGPSVRVADYAPSQSEQMVRQVSTALEGRRAALMANHGAICIGKDLDEALAGSLVLEKAALAYLGGQLTGGAHHLDPLEAKALHIEFKASYSRLSEQNKKSD